MRFRRLSWRREAVQIDRLVWAETGAGPVETRPIRLPHGRYTIFVDYDPSDAVRRFELIDAHERTRPDWSAIPAEAGEVRAPLVQEELPRGNYRVLIDTATLTCSWSVQVVLNALLSGGKPPALWQSRTPAPAAVTLHSREPAMFALPQSGRYLVRWRLGHASEDGFPIHSYTLKLRAADGHEIELGQAIDTEGDRRIDGAYLGAGMWTVDMQTSVDWEVTIAPLVGPLGGGAVGF